MKGKTYFSRWLILGKHIHCYYTCGIYILYVPYDEACSVLQHSVLYLEAEKKQGLHEPSFWPKVAH